MPFKNQNLNSYFFREQVSRNFNEISIKLDDKDNSKYLPYAVQKVYNENIDDYNSGLSIGQYFVLTKQLIVSQNGLYYQGTSTSVVKQSNPSENTFFLDILNENGNKAVYLKITDEFYPVNFDKILLGTSLTTTSSGDNIIFTYPVPNSKMATIKTTINAIDDSDLFFYGYYESSYYNKQGTSILQLNNPGNITLRSDNTNFTIPTITYGTSSTQGKLTLNPNSSNNITWYIKSEVLF